MSEPRFLTSSQVRRRNHTDDLWTRLTRKFYRTGYLSSLEATQRRNMESLLPAGSSASSTATSGAGSTRLSASPSRRAEMEHVWVSSFEHADDYDHHWNLGSAFADPEVAKASAEQEAHAIWDVDGEVTFDWQRTDEGTETWEGASMLDGEPLGVYRIQRMPVHTEIAHSVGA